MKKAIKAKLEDISKVVNFLREKIPENAVIFLRGDLAAGKTTLVKEIARQKGCKEAVTSPTFSIQHIYDRNLTHYDLYQCTNEKFLSMGLLESLDEPGWHLIEWGDEKLEHFLKSNGFYVAVVDINPIENGRLYEVRSDA